MRWGAWGLIGVGVAGLAGCASMAPPAAATAPSGGAFAPAQAVQETVEEKLARAREAADKAPPEVRPTLRPALEARELGRLEEAVALLEQGLRVHPRSPDLYHHLALCYAARGRDPALAPEERQRWVARAREGWKQAWAIDPTFYRAAHNLGVLAHNEAEALQEAEQAPQRQQLLAEARAWWTRAVQAKPDFASGHYNLGVLEHQAEHWAEAKPHYEAALKADPRHSKARANLAIVLFQLAPTPEAGLQAAAEQWRQILAYDADNLYAHFNLGRAQAEVEQWDQAVAHWQAATRAPAREPEERFLLARAWYCLAVIYEQYQPDPVRCLEAIRTACQMFPNNLEYRHMLRRVEREQMR